MTMISVVMGVYNAADTLRETLDSIVGQEDVELEVIVVDDGSTDGTGAILDDYPDIRVIRQENLGLTRALIAGCAAARGTLIARQDAGDLSHPRRLVTQQRMLEDPEVTFVSCATQYVGPEGEPLWIAHPTGVALVPAHVLDLGVPNTLTDGPTHHGSVMFRRDAYERAGGYRAQFYYGQDFDLWFRLAALGKFQTTKEVLYTARIAPNSISGVARHAQRRLGELSRAALEARMRGVPEDPVLAEAAAIRRVAGSVVSPGSGLYFIGEALRRNGDARARSYFRRAIAAQPLLLRAWTRYLQSLLL